MPVPHRPAATCSARRGVARCTSLAAALALVLASAGVRAQSILELYEQARTFDATYLAGPLHFGRDGATVGYWAFVVGVAAVIAAVCMLATRRRPVLAALAGLGTVIALHLVDLVTGAHLEWNTAFGYSPTIGIRFVGQGNMTFSQLTAATVLFAGLLAWQVPTKRGVRTAPWMVGTPSSTSG